MPSNYVKHMKKIGDEEDVSLDYIADHEDEVRKEHTALCIFSNYRISYLIGFHLQLWIKGLVPQGVSKDMLKLVTLDAFERVFNLLERYTGMSKDPIPQFNATKVVQDELQWNEAAVGKLLPLLYAYWLSKRTQLGKPLCRKYWPQITSADTNPRQVFR